MFCVLISLSCGISLKVLNALLKMLLFKNTSFSLQVCAYAMMSWHYSMYAAVSISHLYICVYVMHLSEQKRLRTLKSNQRQDAVLSERKNEFNFRQSYLWKEVSDLSFSLLVFSFSFLLSLLLTVFDCIRQVNEKQQWRNDWQPAPAARTCQSVRLCAHTCQCLCQVVSWPPACQSPRWWDGKRVMRTLFIPSGWSSADVKWLSI